MATHNHGKVMGSPLTGTPMPVRSRGKGQVSAGMGAPTAPRNSCKGQVSVELIIITSVMAALLLLMLMVNNSLQQSWGVQKQVLEATAAANQVAIAMNRANILRKRFLSAMCAMAAPAGAAKNDTGAINRKPSRKLSANWSAIASRATRRPGSSLSLGFSAKRRNEKTA